MNYIPGLVSVIIPTYNRSLLCKKAVESALAQSYPEVEVVVVDDGSADDTRAVLSEMGPKVRYLWQQNAGVSAARNHGIDAARGEYLAFLDSDDTWLPWKLEAQLAAFRAFPGTGMVWTDMVAVDDDDATVHASYLKKMYSAYEYFDPERDFRTRKQLGEVWEGCRNGWEERKVFAGEIFSFMFLGNLVHTSTVLIRRERQQAVGYFDTESRTGEDYDFHFRTCRFGDVAFVDLPSINYRIGAEDQLSGTGQYYWIAKNTLKTVERMLAQARDEIKLPEQMVRRRLSHIYAWLGLEEFHREDPAARGHLWKSLCLDPRQEGVPVHLLLTFFPKSWVGMLKNLKKALRSG